MVYYYCNLLLLQVPPRDSKWDMECGSNVMEEGIQGVSFVFVADKMQIKKHNKPLDKLV